VGRRCQFFPPNFAAVLLNSGTGMLGSVPPGGGAFEPLTFCPGYLRGLAFCDDYAVVGLSRTRQDKTFGGLALEGELSRRGAEARCGLQMAFSPQNRRCIMPVSHEAAGKGLANVKRTAPMASSNWERLRRFLTALMYALSAWTV
jgi:hypothetical protein